MIRNVARAAPDDERFHRAAEGIAGFRLFRKAREIEAEFARLVEEHGSDRLR